MQCLENYRSKQVREANRKLRIILKSPDESAVHDFRVGIKRLTALYGFLNQVDENLAAKKLLKPYRALFKSLGSIRDAQIAIGLIEDSGSSPNVESNRLVSLLRTGIRRDHQRFGKFAGNDRGISIKLPTIRATGISDIAIRRHKPAALTRLSQRIVTVDKRMSDDDWHNRRILLKRYRHTLDAFAFCPGQVADQSLLKRISILESLLGDWHDRIVTTGILQSLTESNARPDSLISAMKQESRVLLGSAKIYLGKFAGNRLRAEK